MKTATRLRGPGRVRPWLLDAPVALVSFVLVAVPLGGVAGTGARAGDVAAYLLALAMALSYLAHRRRPLVALAVCLLSLLLYGVGHFAAYPGFPVFAMVFGLALHAGRRQALWGYLASLLALAVTLGMQPASVVDGSSWFSSLLVLTIAWLAGDNLRSRRARWAALEERARRLEHEREERARQAVAAERMRIARDLHDVVAHSMSVVAVQAGMAHHVIDNRPALAKQALGTIETTSRAALVELRRMLGVLREADQPSGALAPTPGIAQIAQLPESFAEAGLHVTLCLDGEHASVPAGVQLTAYRVVQEALTNALKHGGSTADVLVHSTGPLVVVTVTDPGTDAPSQVPGGGHGLAGMRERVALFGGELEVGPLPEGGFRLTARIPCVAPSEGTPPAPSAGPVERPGARS